MTIQLAHWETKIIRSLMTKFFVLLLGKKLQNHNLGSQDLNMDCGSSSKCNRVSLMNSMENVQQQTLPIRCKSRYINLIGI